MFALWNENRKSKIENRKSKIVFVLLLALSLLLSACGNEETSGDPPGTLPATRLNLADCATAAANITVRPGQSVPTPNATAGVRVDVPAGFKLYISPDQPYATAIPPEWDVRDHQTQGNIKDADLFIIKKSNTSGAYITVIAEKLKDNLDSKSFFEGKYREAQATQKDVTYEQQSNRQVGGVDAYVLAYNTPGGQSFAYPTQSIQVIFAGGGLGWGVTFVASPNQAAQYCPYFARALDSWTFTGQGR